LLCSVLAIRLQSNLEVSLISKLIDHVDVNVVLNFVRAHESNLLKRAPCFVNMCMPGLTEDYKMSLFFNISKPDTGLRYVIVAEEANVKMLDKYEVIANSVF
jgi:hypothetical protein